MEVALGSLPTTPTSLQNLETCLQLANARRSREAHQMLDAVKRASKAMVQEVVKTYLAQNLSDTTTGPPRRDLAPLDGRVSFAPEELLDHHLPESHNPAFAALLLGELYSTDLDSTLGGIDSYRPVFPTVRQFVEEQTNGTLQDVSSVHPARGTTWVLHFKRGARPLTHESSDLIAHCDVTDMVLQRRFDLRGERRRARRRESRPGPYDPYAPRSPPSPRSPRAPRSPHSPSYSPGR